MKRILKFILHVYMVICTCILTLLLIAGLIIYLNIGKITGFFLEKAIDNYSNELNGLIAGYFLTSVPDNSIQFESIKTLPGGGLQASFKLDNSVTSNIDTSSFANKTNMEVIEELGLSLNDLPGEIKVLFSLVKQTLVLDFKDSSGNPFINREVTTKEINEFLK